MQQRYTVLFCICSRGTQFCSAYAAEVHSFVLHMQQRCAVSFCIFCEYRQFIPYSGKVQKYSRQFVSQQLVVPFKGTVAQNFTALVFSSKVSILGPDSYPNFCSNLLSNSQSYSNLKFDSPLHHAAVRFDPRCIMRR